MSPGLDSTRTLRGGASRIHDRRHTNVRLSSKIVRQTLAKKTIAGGEKVRRAPDAGFADLA